MTNHFGKQVLWSILLSAIPLSSLACSCAGVPSIKGSLYSHSTGVVLKAKVVKQLLAPPPKYVKKTTNQTDVPVQKFSIDHSDKRYLVRVSRVFKNCALEKADYIIVRTGAYGALCGITLQEQTQYLLTSSSVKTENVDTSLVWKKKKIAGEIYVGSCGLNRVWESLEDTDIQSLRQYKRVTTSCGGKCESAKNCLEGDVCDDGQCVDGSKPMETVKSVDIKIDCSTVKCAPIQCEEGYELILKPDQCCGGTCKRKIIEPPVDCSTVRCAQVVCEEGYEAILKPGECCGGTCQEKAPVLPPPVPVDCSTVKCAQIQCNKGYELTLKSDQCCGGICQLKPNCKEVQCFRAPCEPICEEDGCDATECLSVKCERGFESVILDGECCPTCQKVENDYCGKMLCPPIKCEKGYISKIPDGECCAQCVRNREDNDCDDTECPPIKCERGFESVILDGECCPTCQKVEYTTCEKIMCQAIDCRNGYFSEVPDGKCCAQCVKDGEDNDCDDIECPLIKCARGYESVTLDEQCCPTCQKVEEDICSLAICPAVLCAPGSISEIPDGECCAQCVKDGKDNDCDDIKCNYMKCGPGFESVILDGECCPTCKEIEPSACGKNLCEKIKCKDGYVSEVPDGECCPMCVPEIRTN